MTSLSAVHLPVLAVSGETVQSSQGAVESQPVAAVESDEELMARICEGDQQALGTLFRRYAGTVRGVAYKVLRDSSEADEFVQDVFLLIHRLCKTFDPTRASVRFWILQMTHNRAISRRRYLTSRHFYSRQDFDEMAVRLCNPSRHADSIGELLEKRETLRSWFEQLSPNQRDTLKLFFFEGFTFPEIAAKLGQKEATVRHHYYRGLDRLRTRIFGLPARRDRRKSIPSGDPPVARDAGEGQR